MKCSVHDLNEFQSGNDKLINIMSSPRKRKVTVKQLLQISLFKSVKHINGEKIFKQLCDACELIQFYDGVQDHSFSSKLYFIYVKKGEVLIYKRGAANKEYKNLIKNIQADEYYGFQDYPLFWNEKVEMQIASNSQLITVNLSSFHRFFRRVIPMTYLTNKAEYMKRLPLFRGVELEKIFKLACLSQKLRIPKGQSFINEGDEIIDIFIISSGKLQLKSSMIKEIINCGQNEDFLAKQTRQGISNCLFTATSVAETQIIAIPKEQFQKIFDIREKLKQPENNSFFSDKKSSQIIEIAEDNDQIQSNKYPKEKASVYSQTFFEKFRSKTEKSNEQKIERKSFTRVSIESRRGRSISKALCSVQSKNYSMGEIQLLKFLKRKEKTESKNFFKYIESRAPEIVLNPSKEFSVVKPVYKSTSQYVRNLKRKIKQINSNSLTLTNKIQYNNFFI